MSGDVLTYWESKYKALRGAFVVWRKIERENKKNRIKILQRLQQLAFDGQRLGSPDRAKDAQFERLRQVLLDFLRDELEP